MTTPTDTLRKLAEAATPGVWYWENGRLRSPEQDGSGVDEYVLNPDHDYRRDDSQIDVSDEDAVYIAAANPATVLALLDENQRLREALVQADLTIRSFQYATQEDVEFIRQALQASGNPLEGGK